MAQYITGQTMHRIDLTQEEVDLIYVALVMAFNSSATEVIDCAQSLGVVINNQDPKARIDDLARFFNMRPEETD